MKKKALAMALACGMAFTMAGCGGGSSSSSSSSADTGSASGGGSGETYDLQVISKGLNNSWMLVVQNGCMQAMEDINAAAGYDKVKVSYTGPDAQTDIAVQVQQVNDAISSGADCIGLAALDADSVTDSLNDAMAAGIPVVGWDSGIPGAPEGSVACSVASDNYSAAAMGADELYTALKDAGRIGTDKKARVGVLSYTATASGHIDRGLGFIDEFAAKCAEDGITVCVTGNDKFVGDTKAESVAEKEANVIIEVRVPSQTTVELNSTEAGVFLNEDDTVAIFANTQDSSEGVLVANENLNKLGTGDDQVWLCGFDEGSVLYAAVEAGTMWGGVNQNPYDIGYQTVETMTKICDGEEVADIICDCVFYNADNLTDEAVAASFYD
ncbi:MAG: substrate-binding domain-containing protein [Butyricicoccus sp.]